MDHLTRLRLPNNQPGQAGKPRLAVLGGGAGLLSLSTWQLHPIPDNWGPAPPPNRQRLSPSSAAPAPAHRCAQVNQGADSVAFQDLYGLWIILASGIGLGTLLMIAQRTMRHYQKHGSLQKGGGGGGGGGPLDGSPLPEGRRPLRLLSALRSLPRSSVKWTASSRAARKGGRASSGANGAAEPAGPTSTLRTPRGATTDLESQATVEHGSLESPSLSAASSPARPAAAVGQLPRPAQAQPSPSQAAERELRRSSSMQRASALQAVDSIYSAVK